MIDSFRPVVKIVHRFSKFLLASKLDLRKFRTNGFTFSFKFSARFPNRQTIQPTKSIFCRPSTFFSLSVPYLSSIYYPIFDFLAIIFPFSNNQARPDRSKPLELGRTSFDLFEMRRKISFRSNASRFITTAKITCVPPTLCQNIIVQIMVEFLLPMACFLATSK